MASLSDEVDLWVCPACEVSGNTADCVRPAQCEAYQEHQRVMGDLLLDQMREGGR